MPAPWARDIIAHGGADLRKNSAAIGAVLDAPRKKKKKKKNKKRLRTIGGSVRANATSSSPGAAYTTALVPEIAPGLSADHDLLMLLLPSRHLRRIAQAVTSSLRRFRTTAACERLLPRSLMTVGGCILGRAASPTRRAEPRDLACGSCDTDHDRNLSAIVGLCRVRRSQLSWSWESYGCPMRAILLPQIARLREGVFYCTAFGGHGLNTTAIGDASSPRRSPARATDIRLFEPSASPDGSPLRHGGVHLPYCSYQARDWWKERGRLRDRGGAGSCFSAACETGCSDGCF